MKKYLVICLLLPTVIYAQKLKDSIKFEMIRATVDFYATDIETFPKSSKKKSACNSGDYKCLIEFCTINELINVEGNINNWKKTELNSKNAAEDFKKMLISELTSKKTHRPDLPDYQAYTQKLNKLIELLKEELPPPLLTKVDSPKKQSLKIPPPSIVKDPTTTLTHWLPWAALIVGLGGLGLGLLAFFKKPKVKSGQVEMATAVELEQVKRNLATLTTQLNQKADAIAIQTLDKKIAAVESSVKNVYQQPTAANTATEAPKSNKPSALAPSATKLYAKQPDLDGMGFSNNILKTEQLGEQAYELTVAETSGSYSISGDRGAQSYAVNDFNFILARGCTLNNQPFTNCRVETIKPGTLSKGKDGWMIESKAVVEFR